MNESAPALALVERLLFGLVSAQIYGPGNPRVLEASAEAATHAASICRAAGTRTVVVGAVANQIIVDGHPLLGASLFAKRLVTRIEERHAGGIELAAEVAGEEIAAVLELLARRGGPSSPEAVNEELTAKRVTTVRLLRPYESGRGVSGGAVGDDGSAPSVEASGDLLPLHQGVVDLLQGATICACQGRDLDLNQVGATVESLIVGMNRDAGGLYALAHYPEHDFFTFGHSIRVGLLAIDVARSMTDDEALLFRVGTAALLHDVGKALVPWDVLHKRGKLDADERREMERHPTLGAGILIATKTADPLSVAAAYGHHRCADGGGYPRSCSETEQTMVTQLVKVCDVFEALTAARPYKPPMSPARAFRVMLDMRGQFDATMLSHFVRTVGIYPSGTEVRLDDDSTARVIRQTGDFHRPLVEVTTDAGGVPVAPGARRPYDLRHPELNGPTMAIGEVLARSASPALV